MAKPPPDPLFVMPGDMSPAHCVLFHRLFDKETLFIGTEDGNVQEWDLKVCKRKRTVQIGLNTCLSLHMVQEYLITQDKQCEIKVWLPFNNFELIHSQKFNNFSFCKIDILEEQVTHIAVPQPDSIVILYLFSNTKFEKLSSLKYSDITVKLGEVLCIKLFRIKSEYIAVIYESGMLIIWNVEGTVIMIEKLTSDTPMAFDFDADLRQGVCGSSGKKIVIFRLDESLKLMKRKNIEITNEGIASLSIRSDGKIFATGCWDGNIRIFSWKTCKLLAVLNCHVETVLSVCFSKYFVSTWKCRNMLIATGSDKRISFWNIYE